MLIGESTFACIRPALVSAFASPRHSKYSCLVPESAATGPFPSGSLEKRPGGHDDGRVEDEQENHRSLEQAVHQDQRQGLIAQSNQAHWPVSFCDRVCLLPRL
jgi:hypothetical protein